jgi:hypothetical protein
LNRSNERRLRRPRWTNTRRVAGGAKREKKNLQKETKVSFVSAALILFGLLLLANLYIVAQDNTLPKVYQAQAMGQGTQLGRTYNITVHIDQYTSSEERQVLVDAFSKDVSQGLFNALTKAKSKGRIAVTGTLG